MSCIVQPRTIFDIGAGFQESSRNPVASTKPLLWIPPLPFPTQLSPIFIKASTWGSKSLSRCSAYMRIRGLTSGSQVSSSLHALAHYVHRLAQSFRSEVVTWKCLRHPHIVPFLGVSNIFPVCLVSEWMPEGTLLSFLKRHPNEQRPRYVGIFNEVSARLMTMHRSATSSKGLLSYTAWV
jgi:serine/threonine protein kinase